jgi:hypothetical protein
MKPAATSEMDAPASVASVRSLNDAGHAISRYACWGAVQMARGMAGSSRGAIYI